MIETEPASNQEFLLRRIILNLEQNRIIPSIKAAIAYAELRKDERRIEEFYQWLEDRELTRRISKIDVVKANPETAYEYFDLDTENDPYRYDDEAERAIENIEVTLWKYVGSQIGEGKPDLETIFQNL